MFITDGLTPEIVLSRVHSCSDLPRTTKAAGVGKSRLFPSGSPPYSEQSSRAETPAFLRQFDSGCSLPEIVAAVAKFFEGNETTSPNPQISEFELLAVDATKQIDLATLRNVYKITVCRETPSGWEGVSLDPLYAGSVFIVSETLQPLHFSNTEKKNPLNKEGPTLDPNCKYCSLADSDDFDRRRGKRQEWMKQCFAAFDGNAGFFLTTPQAGASVASSVLLEPNDDYVPQATTICDDCRELLAPFNGTEPVQSVDYSPSVFQDDRPVYTCTVTREFNPEKFDHYRTTIGSNSRWK